MLQPQQVTAFPAEHMFAIVRTVRVFFFGHLLPRFLLLEAPLVRQAQPTAEASPLHLSDDMEASLEFDDKRHRAPLGQLRVVLINNSLRHFDLTSAIRDRSSKVEMNFARVFNKANFPATESRDTLNTHCNLHFYREKHTN